MLTRGKGGGGGRVLPYQFPPPPFCPWTAVLGGGHKGPKKSWNPTTSSQLKNRGNCTLGAPDPQWLVQTCKLAWGHPSADVTRGLGVLESRPGPYREGVVTLTVLNARRYLS